MDKSPMQKIKDAGSTPLAFRPEEGKGSGLTLANLEKRYGKEQAREVYFRAAVAAGFGNFRNSAYVALPPLDTTSLSGEARVALDRVLADADAEFKPQVETSSTPEPAKE